VIASDDGLDTALARILHEQGSVDLGSLQRALEEVRRERSLDPGRSLALTLQTKALVSREALERAFQAIGERAAQGHQSAVRELGIPPDLGPYRVARELSRGGMGAIHEIVHETSGVSFALKTILPSIGQGAGEELERFRREGEALGRLNHPHVVRVHGANLEGPVPYLIQDLLPGGTLQERIDRGPYLLLDALDLIRQLGEGLQHAHERGVLHRDLKPLNVLFDDRDQARLVDFGLARFASGSSLTHTGQLLGTPAYMAPEQAMGGAVDERTDVYGLAGILFAVLTGRPPFEGSGLGILAAVVQDPPPKPSSLNPEIPPWLDLVLGCGLAKDPDARYPSVRALLEAIENEQAPPERASWRVPILAFVALLAIIVAGIGFQLAQLAHARKQARDELAQRLAPSQGAPAPFADLARDLPRLRRTLGDETAAVLLASGLVAVGDNDPERAHAVLERLRPLPSTKAQVGLLQACCDARWSEDTSALRAADRRLEMKLGRKGEVGFREYRLLLARTKTLIHEPVAALDQFLEADCPLDQEPWEGLVRTAAAEAASSGEFPEALAHRLAEALPQHAREFTSLEDWAEIVRKPNFPDLVELLKSSGSVPPPFRQPTRDFAQRVLPSARMPDPPPNASLTAEGEYWRKPIAGLEIRTELPVSTGVFQTLADWLLVANHLELKDTQELRRVSRDALHSLGPRLDSKHSLQRLRLFEAHLAHDPEALELGTLGLAASTFYSGLLLRAQRTVDQLSQRRPESQRKFWELWVAHLAVLRQPPHSWTQPVREAYSRAWRHELRTLEPWVREITTPANKARLRALYADPAVNEITRVYDDPLAVLLFSLARASLEAGEPYVALCYYDEFKPFADVFPNEGWQGEYMLTLSRAHGFHATPPAELPRIRKALQGELLLAIQSAHPDHLANLLHTAWLERGLLSREAFPELIKHTQRLLETRPALISIRLRSAWYALKLGQEEEARDLLREASRYFAKVLTRVGDRELASKILTASASKLTLETIDYLQHKFSRRPYMPLLPATAQPPERPEQQ
jgi:tetratricopeptide (TPR) repeat protein